MSVLLTVSIKTLKQNWSVTMQMEKEWSEWCRLWNETRQPLRQKWSNTLNNSSAVAEKLFECVWLFFRVGTYRANIQAILPWNFAKLPKWRLCFIVTCIWDLKVCDAKTNAMFTFMKSFMDTWSVSDSFENIKVEIRFIQCELKNRADVLFTMHITNLK